MTIDELRHKELIVLKLISNNKPLIFPQGDLKLKQDDLLYVTCSIQTLKELKALQQ